MKKIFGFTLAEALIVVLVIGVVAALTIPGVVNNYQRDSFATHIKKVAFDFSNASELITINEGKSSFEGTGVLTDDTKLDNFMTTYMRAKSKTNLFNSQYRKIKNGQTSNYSCDGRSYLLPGGIAACVKRDVTSFGEFKRYLTVHVDLNGKSGPNISGRDFFRFYVTAAGQCQGLAPSVTLENIIQAINFLLNSTSGDCVEGLSIDANGDGRCNIADLTTLINMKLQYDPGNIKSNCINNNDGSNCLEQLQYDGWKMKY